jgi:hypothetical protein
VSDVFTVKSVGTEPREWSSQHGGTFLSYKVDLEYPDGKVAMGVEWNKKPESQAPREGEQVAGHLEEGRWSEKFKIDYEATKELGQSSPSRGASGGGPKGKAWQPESQRDPERAARILRQHSQSCAIEAIKLLDKVGLYEREGPLGPDLLKQEVGIWTDFFDQDVNAAGQISARSETAPTTDSAPGSPSADEDIEMALDTAGLVYAPARAAVANYMALELTPADLLRACNQLINTADLETQAMTLRAMRQRAENWTGQPLPSEPDPDDSIPF